MESVLTLFALPQAELLQFEVRALRTPHVFRRCARCDQRRPFVSSERFRVNAHQRLLDVWLIYHCNSCGLSWNAEILERTPAHQVDSLQAYLENCSAQAWREAFEVNTLRSRGLQVEAAVPYEVRWRSEDLAQSALDPGLTIEIRLVDPVEVRLDRLLADELGFSRSQVSKLSKEGVLRAESRAKNPLRRAAFDRQKVFLHQELCQKMLKAAPSDSLLGLSLRRLVGS